MPEYYLTATGSAGALASRLTWVKLGSVLLSVTLWTGGVFVVIFALEVLGGADRRRYLSRHFANDLLYRVFFGSGVLRLFLYLPLATFLQPWLTLPSLAVLGRAPLWVGVPLGILIPDFLAYWFHRFEHTRIWWRFHQVHHSQEQLTFLTGSRHHPFEWILEDGITFILVALGAPTITWLPYRLFITFHSASVHAQLNWRLGPLGYLLVSPVFHSVHHSTDPACFNRNFGGMFACWDHLFGTASQCLERPVRTGVEGYRVPEFMPIQVAVPILDLFHPRRETGPPEAEPRPPCAMAASSTDPGLV